MGEILKKEFRKKMLFLRDALPEAERRNADRERDLLLFENTKLKEAEWILSYVSFKSEADTKEIICRLLSEGKKVAVPKVNGQTMDFYRIYSLSELAPGYRGIPEPAKEEHKICTCELPVEKTVIITPGSAFDRKGGRIGYGGGFYDRFFSDNPLIYRMALAYEVQLVDNVPREPHDFLVREIITEKYSYKIS